MLQQNQQKERTKGYMQRAPRQSRENSCHSRKSSPPTAGSASCWSRRLVAPKSYEGGIQAKADLSPYSSLRNSASFTGSMRRNFEEISPEQCPKCVKIRVIRVKPRPFSNPIKVFKAQHQSIHPKKSKFIQPNQSISTPIKVNQTHPPQLSTFNPQPTLLPFPHRHAETDFQVS
jgi:hypothetical protein